jgi:hypothetical protein
VSDRTAIVVAIIGIVVPFFTLIGAAVRWVWVEIRGWLKRNEDRFAAIEAELEECRQREVESRERRMAQLTVIELLWLKVRELDPGAEVLKRAEHLLDKLRQGNRLSGD